MYKQLTLAICWFLLFINSLGKILDVYVCAVFLPLENKNADLKERNIHVYRILGSSLNLVYFVIQPLFYLNGDANFRNRVLQKGLWKALKIELFQTTQTGQSPPLWKCSFDWNICLSIYVSQITLSNKDIYTGVDLRFHSTRVLL